MSDVAIRAFSGGHDDINDNVSKLGAAASRPVRCRRRAIGADVAISGCPAMPQYADDGVKRGVI